MYINAYQNVRQNIDRCTDRGTNRYADRCADKRISINALKTKRFRSAIDQGRRKQVFFGYPMSHPEPGFRSRCNMISTVGTL